MVTMRINEHPKGYLVMDTNCFSHYCEGGKVAGFDYDKIRVFVEREGYWVVITPYTLYECVQDLTEPKNIIEERNKWINARDFWVLNVNKLIGDKYNFEYGPDFLFDFGFDANNLEKFTQKRKEWRDKVYASLAPRIVLLAQIIAVIYVIITEWKNDGVQEQEANWKRWMINQLYGGTKIFDKHLSEFLDNISDYAKGLNNGKDVNARDYLVLFVENVVLLMLSNAEDFIRQLRVGYSDITLICNDTVHIDGHIRRKFLHDKMAARYVEVKNGSNKMITIEKKVEEFLKGCEPIFKQLYKRVVTEWFVKGYKGKELANTIIDFVNMGVLEVDSTLPCVYITEENGFVSLIKGMKDGKAKASQDFYMEFYEGWDKVVAEKM